MSHAQVRINEVLATANDYIFEGGASDWVELYNSGAQTVNLAGYSLSDTTSTPTRWVFPANVNLAPGQFLVVLLDSSRPVSTSASGVLNAGFGIKASGDRVLLYSPAQVLIESVRFGPQATDFSIGRIPAGTGDFVLTTPTPGSDNVRQELGPQNALRINEWMASPPSGEDDWFELYNPGELPVMLTGLYFTDDNNDPSPVAPYSFIGAGLNAFLQIFADNSTNDNEVDFGLSGGGDSITLHFGNGTVIDRVQFGQQTANVSQGRLPDGSSTIRSLNRATPGRSNLVLYEGLVVNEVLSHTDPPFEDAVEFLNTTSQPIDIGGWYLSDSRTDLRRYRVPTGTIVPANGYIVFYEHQFNGPEAVQPFVFNSAHGDRVFLSQTVNDELTGYAVEEQFEAAANGVSFGRIETSVPGDHKFVLMIRPTFGVDNPTSLEHFRTGTGAANSGPLIGPIVINEIMYHPPPGEDGMDNSDDEYVELLNITGAAVGLFDPAHPENRWVLTNGLSFQFPASTTIPAGGFALVVSFNPADSAKLAAFVSKYSVPQNAQIFGPYQGRLGNGGDEVELYRPDTPQPAGRPDAGFVPYVRVDKVNYSDVAPWPTEPDGGGQSLQKKNPGAFGNDPIHWDAANPSAGRPNSADLADADGDGMPDAWEQLHGFDPSDPSDASEDADHDGLTNLQEYIAGTDPRDATSVLRVIEVQGPQADSPALVRFSSVPGKSYSVEYRNSLQPSSVWQNLVSTNATGTTTTIPDVDAAARRDRYYRIVTPAAE